MHNKKRGLSTIIATLIMILLVLVAVGIVWVVINNILSQSAEEVSLGKFTLNTQIEAVDINETSNNVSVKVKRNPGQGELSGIKFIFSDGANTETFDRSTNLKELETRKFIFNLINLNVSNLVKISITPVFKTESGEEIVSDILETYDTGKKGVGSFDGSGGDGEELSTDTTPPSTPTNLQANTISSSQINLAWGASTDNVGVSGYKIYRDGTEIATSATTSYSDTNLQSSATYTYTVSAYDAAGNEGSKSVPDSGTTFDLQTLAFPGAEGFGRFAKGGRGGFVIEVTNLNDSGAGSLRAALEASGPRIVVFQVSGTINLNNWIRIENPFLTIAGQTAPGDGVTIKGMLDLRTHDVVIRYIRVRPGPESIPSPDVTDAIAVTYNSNNVILDHVSLSWASDEVSSVWGPSNVNNITIQWSIISESLNCPPVPYRHSKGCHGKGTIIGGGATNVSYHHNLLAHHHDRNPLLNSGYVDLVNNIIYYSGNQGTTLNPGYGIIKVNIVGNNYVLYSSPTDTKDPVRLRGGETYSASSGVYVEGNIHPNARPNNLLPEEDILRHTGIAPFIDVVGSPYNYPPITTTDAFQAKTDVLSNAGATRPVRDPVDTRIVNDVNNGTGGIINMPDDVGGYPILSFGTPPADNDHDGMPDTWELANGFNPNDASDGSQDSNGDGYTNLEEYLNGIV